MDDIDAWAATDGLPEVADDDSYADGVHEAARDRDAPGALPPDREDGPLGLEDYGSRRRSVAGANPCRPGWPARFPTCTSGLPTRTRIRDSPRTSTRTPSSR